MDELQTHLSQGTPVNFSRYIREWDDESLSPDYRPDPQKCLYFMLGCGIIDELTRGLLFYNRLLALIEAVPRELLEAFNLLKFLHARKYSAAINHLQHTPWTEGKPLVEILQSKLVRDMRLLLHRSHQKVSMESAKKLTGLGSNEEVAEALQGTIEGQYLVIGSNQSQPQPRDISESDIISISKLLVFLEGGKEFD